MGNPHLFTFWRKQMKDEVVKLLSKEIKLSKNEILNLVEIPPNDELGDFSFPCFGLAKIEKKNPLLIAENLAEKLRKDGLGKNIDNVSSTAGYVNFFIDKKILASDVLKNSGKIDNLGKGKKIVIDMSSPNIAKPFGIGHLRSTIIGNSISEISKALGYKVVKINYLGDWGTQFGKLITGFKKYGSEDKLKKDPIKHMLEIYVKVSKNDKLDQDARDWFKKLEDGDASALKLWKKFKDLSLKEFDLIYKFLGIEFDVMSGESFYNNKMDKIISELQKKKLVKKSDGALIVDLEKYNLGVGLIQKSDETTLYATRDITAAIERYKKYKFEKLIYEVGQEQTLHFKQVFKILELMGYKWNKNCVHVAHGLYLDKDGKKFATRKGKTIFMQDILDETIDLAKKALVSRDGSGLSKAELDGRAKKIALGAIFYGDLKNSRQNNMIFDIQKFLSFEGDTGPYLLYSYARASSIVRRVKSKKGMKIIDLKESEIKLLKKLDGFGGVVEKAYKNLAPNLIANYSYELAQIFNEFYHNCPVLGSVEEGFRLKLVDSFRIVMKKSLGLLGIDVLEEM